MLKPLNQLLNLHRTDWSRVSLIRVVRKLEEAVFCVLTLATVNLQDWLCQ